MEVINNAKRIVKILNNDFLLISIKQSFIYNKIYIIIMYTKYII